MLHLLLPEVAAFELLHIVYACETCCVIADRALHDCVGCMQVYEGQWQGQTVAIKVLDGAAAASQKAMKEVGSFTKSLTVSTQLLDSSSIGP